MTLTFDPSSDNILADRGFLGDWWLLLYWTA